VNGDLIPVVSSILDGRLVPSAHITRYGSRKVKDPLFLARFLFISLGRIACRVHSAQVILYHAGGVWGYRAFRSGSFRSLGCSSRVRTGQVTATFEYRHLHCSLTAAAQTDCDTSAGVRVHEVSSSRVRRRPSAKDAAGGPLGGFSASTSISNSAERRHPDARPSHDYEEHWDDQDIGRHPPPPRSGSSFWLDPIPVGGDRWNGQICGATGLLHTHGQLNLATWLGLSSTRTGLRPREPRRLHNRRALGRRLNKR